MDPKQIPYLMEEVEMKMPFIFSLVLIAVSVSLPTNWTGLPSLADEAKQEKKTTKNLEELVKELRDKDPKVRLRAAETIPKLIGEQLASRQDKAMTKEENAAMAAFFALIDDEDLEVRKAFVRGFEDVFPEAKIGVPILIKALAIPYDQYRQYVIGNLAEYGWQAKEAIPHLRPFLKDKNSETRITAALTLVVIDRHVEGLAPVLAEALQNEDAKAGDNVSAGIRKADSAFFLQAKSGTRAMAAAGLSRIGKPAVPYLIDALKSKDKEIRGIALTALATIGPGSGAAVPRLIEMLEDPEFCKDAAVVLGRMGPAAEPAVPILIKALNGSNEGLAFEVPLTLAELGPVAKAAVPALIEKVKSGDFTAAMVLGRIGPEAKDAIPALKEALKNEITRVEAAGSLWDITRQKELVIPVLKADVRGSTFSNDKALKIIARMGAEAKEMVPFVIEHLKANENPYAAIALGKIGPAAKSAVPVLKAIIQKHTKVDLSNSELRLASLQALWEISADKEFVFPVLMAELDNPESGFKDFGLEIIGSIGPPAKEFVPYLLLMSTPMACKSPETAMWALEKVDLESARKAGIPPPDGSKTKAPKTPKTP